MLWGGSSSVPARASAFTCRRCDRVYKTNQMLRRHLRFSGEQRALDKTLASKGAVPGTKRQGTSSRGSHVAAEFPKDVMGNASLAEDPRVREAFKGKTSHAQQQALSSMHPDLHGEIHDSLEAEGLDMTFNSEGGFEDCVKSWDTSVVGSFSCENKTCSTKKWKSGNIVITIRLYGGEKYNAVVWHQRCRQCDDLGALKLEAESYAARLVFRVKRWYGIEIEAPPFPEKTTKPHESALCEGCKRGHCRLGAKSETRED